MPAFSHRKSGQPADALVAPPPATAPQEFAADLVRYRNLATALAVRRKSGQGAVRGGTEASRPTSGGEDTGLSSARAPTGARTSRATRAVSTIVLAGLVLAFAAAWLWTDSRDVRDVKVLGRPEGTDTANARAAPPELESVVGANPADAGRQLPSPLEAALIVSSAPAAALAAAPAAALADLHHRLQQAEALSDSYAARLVREQAHNRILEEELAARLAEAPQPEPTIVPSPSEPGPLAPLQPSAAQPPQPTAVALPLTEAIPPPVLSAATLDRLMQRAHELREQGDIAAVRTVLESGADSGHGPAMFQLAETYDPATLSAWRTFGTKGDVAKARELYLKAEQAGVAEATERLNGLVR